MSADELLSSVNDRFFFIDITSEAVRDDARPRAELFALGSGRDYRSARSVARAG